MSAVPNYMLMLVVTGLIFVLFVAGAGLITYALITRRRSAPAGLASSAQPRPSSIPLIIGIILLLASLASCAYSSWLMMAGGS